MINTSDHTRESFANTVERLFDMARANIRDEGFTTEMLLGFDQAGRPACTFVGSGDMDPHRLTTLMPQGVRVVSRPLVTAATLLAAGLALSGTRSAIYVGTSLLGDQEYLVAAGVTPSAVQALSYAIPTDQVPVERATVRSTDDFSPVTPELLAVENWLMSLIPSEVEDWTADTIAAILAS